MSIPERDEVLSQQSTEEFCLDEGCPHYGMKHICIEQPVGVEGLAKRIETYHWDAADKSVAVKFAAELRSLAQQPTSDGGFTAADMMDARQEGRKEGQQPAAVDDDTLESLIEESDGHWEEDEFRIEGPDLMYLLRRVALAIQQGGVK